MSYAEGTTVPVEKSRMEIETTLRKYGADQFFSGWDGKQYMISFRAHARFVRFVLVMPDKKEKRFTEKKQRNRYYTTKLTEQQSIAAHEAEIRRLWRALLLAIKAKLEIVEAGIATFEQEFLAHIVLPDSTLVGDRIKTVIAQAYETGKTPLLGAPSEAA